MVAGRVQFSYGGFVFLSKFQGYGGASGPLRTERIDAPAWFPLGRLSSGNMFTMLLGPVVGVLRVTHGTLIRWIQHGEIARLADAINSVRRDVLEWNPASVCDGLRRRTRRK
jgi:hypothetical protein